MPLVRKASISAASSGLVITPSHTSTHAAPTLIIGYGGYEFAAKKSAEEEELFWIAPQKLEIYGLIGMLRVGEQAFLIAITSRKEVAQIAGKSIYNIGEVAVIPTESQKDAQDAIDKASHLFKGRLSVESSGDNTVEEDSGEENLERSASGDEPEFELETSATASRKGHKRSDTSTSIVKDVIENRGFYGRFTDRWFSTRGWTAGQERTQGLSIDKIAKVGEDEALREGENTTNLVANKAEIESSISPTSTASEGVTNVEPTSKDVDAAADTAEQKGAKVVIALLPKLLRTVSILFGTSKSFYFSYDHDITRTTRPSPNVYDGRPLSRLVDPEFFWNAHLLNGIVEAGQESSWALPLIQGFVGQSKFSVLAAPSNSTLTEDSRSEELVLTLLSRKSIHRAGLRYLRRGVDGDGMVANFVETEQCLASLDWSRLYSFTLVRGSIPLYFQQSPYSFKPKPVVLQTPAANLAAFQAHLAMLRRRYGGVHGVSLVERNPSPEAIVGQLYEKLINDTTDQKLFTPSIGLTWWDFHKECRGMRFENVKILLEELAEMSQKFGWTEMTKLGNTYEIGRQQAGVHRVNCMDSLDRTNVVQASLAWKALELQLDGFGGSSMKPEGSSGWFNILWADNGDAISRAYSSTGALKGDFTRTGKRNYRGALNDFGLTLTRFFNNIFLDYFTQATIDFVLGNVTSKVFDEFQEKMTTSDPGVSISKMRENAIEVASKIVVDDDEDFKGGWVFLSPREENTLKTVPFSESVVLLTSQAIYFCKFDFDLEKVVSFERIDLRKIIQVEYGAYIISALSQQVTDPARNSGFLIRYQATPGDIVRVNTRSVTSAFRRNTKSDLGKTPEARLLAFKIIPYESFIDAGNKSTGLSLPQVESKLAESVAKAIEAACLLAVHPVPTANVGQAMDLSQKPGIVLQKDIISVDEAKKNTGYLEQLGYNFRRLVWA